MGAFLYPVMLIKRKGPLGPFLLFCLDIMTFNIATRWMLFSSTQVVSACASLCRS
nr:hypothetical protein NNZKBPFO_HPZBYUEE_CDS_0045 [Przondovirus K11]